MGVPVIYAARAGRPRHRDADAWRTWMVANNATIMIVLFLILGAKMAGSGITSLAS